MTRPTRSEASLPRLVPPLLLLLGLGLVVLVGEGARREGARAVPGGEAPGETPMQKSEEAWRRELTPEQYRVLREKGTERAFTGAYWATKTPGTYRCAGCDTPLFLSDAKFDSGCGWPSFFQPLDGARLLETQDLSHGMVRTEVCCRRCGGHLGHVFDDGPAPTGLRFCINSASIRLEPADGR